MFVFAVFALHDELRVEAEVLEGVVGEGTDLIPVVSALNCVQKVNEHFEPFHLSVFALNTLCEFFVQLNKGQFLLFRDVCI